MRYTLTIFFCLLTAICFSQDAKYDKGLKAFDSKEFMKALKIMKPYADSGDPTAQFITGYCYYNKELDIKNDSIAENYLLKSAEQQYGRAMGLLSLIYFEKGMINSKYKVDALVWAQIAAAYDPVQKGTSTRYLIKAYMTETELKKVENILKEKKNEFDKIDIQEFLASNNLNITERNSDKTKIPENTFALIKNPYSDWVSRWKYENFECDTIYYTKNIDIAIIDKTIAKIKSEAEFELSSLYRGKLTENLKLTKEEREILVAKLSTLKEHIWAENLFPYSKRLDDKNQIQSAFDFTENLETEKEKNMCSIVYTFSKPIFLRNNSLVLFLDQKRYRTNYTQLRFSFYSYENDRWIELSDVYVYFESSKN